MIIISETRPWSIFKTLKRNLKYLGVNIKIEFEGDFLLELNHFCTCFIYERLETEDANCTLNAEEGVQRIELFIEGYTGVCVKIFFLCENLICHKTYLFV